MRFLLILLFAPCFVYAADSDRIKLDASMLAAIPAKRNAALQRYAITGEDGAPDVSRKKAEYIGFLKQLVHDLISTYYWHPELPKNIDQALETRAIFQAGLLYPASSTTGASSYGILVQDYTICMYEEEVVTIAFALSERFTEEDVVVVHGAVRPFAAWKKSWDEAGPDLVKADVRLTMRSR